MLVLLVDHNHPSSYPPSGQYSCSGALAGGAEGETLAAPRAADNGTGATSSSSPRSEEHRYDDPIGSGKVLSCNRKDELGARTY